MYKKKSIFKKKVSKVGKKKPNKGKGNQPPKNNTTIRTLIRIIFNVSDKKKRTKPTLEYSTL